MKKVILAIIATVVIGKMLPLLIVALLIVGLAVMIKAALEEQG